MDAEPASSITCNFATLRPEDAERVLVFEAMNDKCVQIADVAIVRERADGSLEVVLPAFGGGTPIAVPIEAVERAIKDAKSQLLLE